MFPSGKQRVNAKVMEYSIICYSFGCTSEGGNTIAINLRGFDFQALSLLTCSIAWRGSEGVARLMRTETASSTSSRGQWGVWLSASSGRGWWSRLLRDRPRLHRKTNPWSTTYHESILFLSRFLLTLGETTGVHPGLCARKTRETKDCSHSHSH